ncbi:MAG: acyl-CoA thioesterase [Deltaproteobacteria bacterium]|nr:acyl-CoA thioesterase [Deltaproteobacteria bacterium]
MSQAAEFAYELMIRELHLDTFGHVNNATYADLFEEARWQLITQNGYGLKEVQERKIGPVVLEMDIKFLRELTLRERVKIVSKMLSYEKKIARMSQIIYNEKGEEACTGLYTFGLFDLKARKLIPPTPEWLKAIGWII